MICKVCDKEYKNLGRHVSVHYKHIKQKNKKMFYFHDYYKDEYNIIDEYLYNKKSALNIANDINENFGCFPVQKNDVLTFLKNKGVNRRTTSEAGKEYFKKNPVWNKGLTKYDHDSIMQYAKSREGKNNPIYSLTLEERQEKIYYWLFKNEDELKEIRSRISKTLKKGYKSGRVKHISKTNPKKYQEIHSKMLKGYRFALQNGMIKRQSYVSSYEKRIANALESLNIRFVQQKSCNKKYRYDFFIESLRLYIEFNGDYWHANPQQYTENFYHPHKKILARDIWEYDRCKCVNVVNSGYNFIIIWENEVKDMDDLQLKEFISGIIKNKER